MCQHGRPMSYKSIMKRDGSLGHVFECAAAPYPDPNQCESKWINPPKKGN